LLRHFTRILSFRSSIAVEEVARDLLRLGMLLLLGASDAGPAATHEHMVLARGFPCVLLHLRLLLLLLLHSLLLLVMQMDIQPLRGQVHYVGVVLDLISKGWSVCAVFRRSVRTRRLPGVRVRLLLALHVRVRIVVWLLSASNVSS
jgi:hypothetical protein